jgi:hypothetical protein
MGDEYTGPDAIRIYHTGAASHNAAQTDPDASIGNYKSSTEATGVTINESGVPSNITVEMIGGNTSLGAATLAFPTADTAQYTPPGGTIGSAVTILNGQTKIIRGGGSDYDKYVRIARTSATALSGTATLTISDTENNAVGFDNVSAAEQSAGDDEYRCLAYYNDSAVTVQGFLMWLTTLGTQRVSDVDDLPASGAGYIEISSGTFDDWPQSGFVKISTSAGVEKEVAYYSERTSTKLTVPSAGRGIGHTSATAGTATDKVDAIPMIEIHEDPAGVQTTGAGANPGDEDTAPSGIAAGDWVTPTSSGDADVINIGNIASGSHIKIWSHRITVAGATEGVDVLNSVDYKFSGP